MKMQKMKAKIFFSSLKKSPRLFKHWVLLLEINVEKLKVETEGF